MAIKMTSNQTTDKNRVEIHDALSHKTRIKILKVLRDHGPLGFAELKVKSNTENNSTLQFHLLKLGSLIEKQLGNYAITEEGRAALLAFQPIEKYNEDARFREQVGLLIRALRSDIESVQEISIVQLSFLGQRVIPYLTSALSTAIKEAENQEKNNYYYDSSRKRGPENAIRSIVKALGIISVPSTVDDVSKALPRTEAFDALAKIGNKQALDAIVQSISKWYFKNIDTYYSDPYGHPLTHEDDEKATQVDEFARNIVNHFEEEAQRSLETAMVTDNFLGKQVIARMLGVIGDDRSVGSLLTALEKENFAVKAETAKALRRLKANTAVDKLVEELLKTQELFTQSEQGNFTFEENERENAREACKAMVQALLDLGSINDWIKIAFHRPRDDHYAEPFDKALIESKEQAVPALTKLLSDPDASIQTAAAEMIARIKRGKENSDYYSRYRY
ncbi:hypothetical protein G4O51_03070 [Candidatus Bathyarchaeota archaeon A05DMB-2]|jgi:HEAT repeat protein|nr:hypothetical protein [Candidatus Bathyarchaeota archaeon A05DMB-2]